MLIAAVVGFQMFSVTWVALPITTDPKFMVDLLRTSLDDAGVAACETPDNKIRAKTRPPQGVRSSFTGASCEPHSTYMRRGIYIHCLRSRVTGNIKQHGQFLSLWFHGLGLRRPRSG
jgi:hypothetical protein